MTRPTLPLGPVMLDVPGTALTPEDRELLCHPAVGGVILFRPNYESPAQLAALTREIHDLRDPPLLIAVDHEGGRVQRFRQGFTHIPAMRRLGERWDDSPRAACDDARAAGLVLAAELRRCGVDLSFTPVLDLDYGASTVIGNRALHSRADAVVELAAALIGGLADGGLPSVGKHFPGHGFVAADSHLAVPEDGRSLDEIFAADLLPYRRHRELGLAGVMPAHVIYTAIDPLPAGFSPFWLQEVLRRRLGFEGLVFSDDLSMEGARVAGSVADSARAALAAGCDMVLVCNDRPAALSVVAAVGPQAMSVARLGHFVGRVAQARPPASHILAQALDRLSAMA